MSRALAFLLAPVVLAQARRLSAATPRLDPPPEPWEGVAGSGGPGAGDPPAVRRLLVIGDSTAIGTGVDDVSLSLAARLAEILAREPGDAADDAALPRDARTVAWRALGRNGLTAAEVVRDVLPAALDDPADLVVVVVGWNDALHLRSPRAFARDAARLVRAPAARRPGRTVVLVAPPRFDRLAVLPQPLRRALGAASAGLARVSGRVAATWGAVAAPGFDGRSTASDRFHPDADGYARMAEGVAAALRERR